MSKLQVEVLVRINLAVGVACTKDSRKEHGTSRQMQLLEWLELGISVEIWQEMSLDNCGKVMWDIYANQLMRLKFSWGKWEMTFVIKERYDVYFKSLNYILFSCTLTFQSSINSFFEKKNKDSGRDASIGKHCAFPLPWLH